MRQPAMTPERLYEQCRPAVRRLIRGLQTKNLSVIQQQVSELRLYLTSRESFGQATARGLNLMRLEQLDALDGLAESMQHSLDSIRETADTEFERILSTMELLQHLSGTGESTPDDPLLVC